MAKIFLTPTDEPKLAGNGDIFYGATTGNQTVIVNAGVTNVSINSEIEAVNFTDNLADYKFLQKGNSIVVSNAAGVVVSTIRVQADADGTALKFGNSGIYNATMVGGIIKLGGVTVNNADNLTNNSAAAVTGAAAIAGSVAFSITSSATSVDEGTPLTFTVSTAAKSVDQTLSYQIAHVAKGVVGVSSIADFTSVNGTVVVPANATSATFTITPVSDGDLEGFEGFQVTLVDSAYSALATSQTIVIKDPVDSNAGNVFNLTQNRDVATSNVFESHPVIAAGIGYINTLSDIDVLTGTGTNPTLNVEFGTNNNINNTTSIVQPKLYSIQTVNVEWTGAQTDTIDLTNSDAITNVNVTRITTNNVAVSVKNLDNIATTLSLANASRAGAVTFDYREEQLVGANESLAVNVTNARAAALNLTEGGDGGADQGYFFETINLTSTGVNDFDNTTVQQNGREDTLLNLAADTTKQTLNIVANGTPASGLLELNNLQATGVDYINIDAKTTVNIIQDSLAAVSPANDGINTPDLRTLTIQGAANVTIDGLDTTKQSNGNATSEAADHTLVVNASALTGNLTLGVLSSSDADSSTSTYAFHQDKDVSITSGSGNDKITTYNNLAGDITTGLGDDIVKITLNATTVLKDLEGVSTISTGAGNDTVTANDLLVTKNDQDLADNDNYDDVTAANITTGDGNDTVTVSQLGNGNDWDNITVTDGNLNDLYVVKGATVDTGAGNDTITAKNLLEGASVLAGDGNDTFTVGINSVEIILAADTDANQLSIVTSVQGSTASDRTDEVNTDGNVNTLGAVVDLGTGTADVASFTETDTITNTGGVIAESGQTAITILGTDAELRGAETLNVTALDAVTVVAATSTADADAITAGTQSDLNTTIIGTQTANFTILNQIIDDNAGNNVVSNTVLLSSTVNDNNDADGAITADIMRFDSSLTAVNLASQENYLQTGPATEVYQAGTATTFTLNNMRAGVALSLSAYEATGVTAGALVNDSLLAINAMTGVATDTVGAKDVTLNINYDNARGLTDAAALTVNALGAFDLSLNVDTATATDTVLNIASSTDDDTALVENYTLTFSDAFAHSVDLNGFGDFNFRATRAPAVAGDVSSTANTSLTFNTGALAGTGVQIDNVDADRIIVQNAAGTAVTAANVTLRVDAENNYTITTGSGTDILDLRDDVVRADDITTTVDRADRINAGAGRDTLILKGDNSLSSNDLNPGVVNTATQINDDVFTTIAGVETIVFDSSYTAGAKTNAVTLDEAAAVTAVDTLRYVGSDDQTSNIVLGNNYFLSPTNGNGQLTAAVTALVIDASLQTGKTILNIENKDDDTDQALVNLDVRASADGGAKINLVNTGSTSNTTEVRLYTANEGDALAIRANGVATAVADNDININVVAAASTIQKIVLVEGANFNDNTGGGAGGTEGAITVTIPTTWTGAAFEFDASALTNTDAAVTTGGATITVDALDATSFTFKGTQNNDTITGGVQADTIIGNEGNDTLSGEGLTNLNKVQTVTFAATYDSGDVITLTHNGNAITATIGVDGVTATAVAAAIAAYDSAGADGIAGDNIVTAGTAFANATSGAAAGVLTLTGTTLGEDYTLTATTNNDGDNTAQVQTLTVTDLTADGWSTQLVWNGITFTVTNAAGITTLNTAVAAYATGATATLVGSVITLTGPTSGAALPLISQSVFAIPADDSGVLALTAATLGTDQANPTIAVTTPARSLAGAADSISGGLGDDILEGYAGADTLDGGDGSDTATYANSLAGVTVNLALATAQVSTGDASGDIILVSIENVTGSAYADTLTGTTAANTITGGAGVDTLTGGAGVDTFVTTTGAAYTTATADRITDFVTGSTGDVLNISITDSTAIASLGVVAAGNGSTAIAGNLVVKTMTAGTGVTLAATDEIVVISGTFANSAALLASIGTGAGIITKSAVNTTTNGLLVVWSDGTDTHVSAVSDAGADAPMTTADLAATDIVVLTGVLTGFDTANFVAV